MYFLFSDPNHLNSMVDLVDPLNTKGKEWCLNSYQTIMLWSVFLSCCLTVDGPVRLNPAQKRKSKRKKRATPVPTHTESLPGFFVMINLFSFLIHEVFFYFIYAMSGLQLNFFLIRLFLFVQLMKQQEIILTTVVTSKQLWMRFKSSTCVKFT